MVPSPQAVNELNIKPRNWKDLLTEEPFAREDIIHIQDPLDLKQREVRDFDHVKKQFTVNEGTQVSKCAL